MTNPYQPELHPDADALNAFAEDALPLAARQQTLVHLATCPECRQILALALPEAGPQDLIKAPSAWARLTHLLTQPSCRLASASVALASLVTGTVLLLRPHPQDETSTTTSVTAQNQRPPVPASPIVNPIRPPAKPTPMPGADAAIRGAPLPITGTNGPVLPRTPAQHSSQADGSASFASVPLAPRMRLQEQPPLPLPLAPAPAGQPPHPSAMGRSAGVMAPMLRAAPSSAAPSGAPRPASLDGKLLGGSVDAETGAASNRTGAAATATRTLAYAANAVNLGDAIVAKSVQPVAGRTAAALPGDRPILASAARGPLVIAVNDQHNAFSSSDGGAHWQPVLIAWAGHAVGVRLQPLTAIFGTITDISGASVAGATVTLQSPPRTATTDSSGRFTFDDVPPGSVHLQASAPGFTVLSQNLTLAPGTPLHEDLHLQVGQASETVSVDATSQLVTLADQVSAEPVPARKAKTAAPAKAASPLPKPAAAPAPTPAWPPPSAQFEIVTDDGRHFTSSDGRTWLPAPTHP